jgi:sugar/nucleoside kinase (ribokinase family)
VVVITDPSGARAVVGGAEVSVSRPAVERAVDTTGAGDAFAAGLLARLADGPWPPETSLLRDALEAAALAATEAILVPGAQGRTASESGGTLSA